jgi:CHAT domain-containing protein
LSVDPKVFRPEDIAALVADTVLRLIESGEPDRDLLEIASELATVLRDGEMRGLADRGSQYWYWVAAIESALAFFAGDGTGNAKHKGQAFRALRLAMSSSGGKGLLPIAGWVDAEFEEFWKVSLAAQALAVVWLSGGRMAPADVRAELNQIASIAASHGAVRLVAAVQRVARELSLSIPATPTPRTSSALSRGMRPADIASRMIRDGRPDLCEPTVKRSVLAELVSDAGADGPVAVRLAELLEGLAVADIWPFMFGGPPSGWGAIRGDPLFDSLFYRAAAIGAGRRTGRLSWRNLPDLVAGRSTVWLRELDADLSQVIVVSSAPHAGWRSSLVRLRQRASEALGNLAAGRAHALGSEDFQELGDLLLGPLLADTTCPQLLTAVLSPALRCLPLEALRVEDKALADNTLVSVLPSLLAVATRNARGLEPGDKLRVVGLFDPSLTGAKGEIEALRDLVRRDQADGVGFNGPKGLRRALEAESWDLLTVAAHGTVRGGVPLLELPGGTLSLPELLEWTLPPVVNLGACRSAQASGAAVPLEWVTAALRRGARSVVAARWPIPDHTTARITTQFYANLAKQKYQHAAPAFWDAIRSERDRSLHPWLWAGLGLFGDEL